MSGGSLDYIYQRVDDAAAMVAARARTARHRAFAAHLQKVSVALHDLEWVLSCDYRPGDEDAAIDACLHPGAALEASIAQAQSSLEELRAELAKVA